MGILNDVMQYRARKEADREAQANAIPQALLAYQSAKQTQQDNLLKQLTVQATLAKSGLAIGPNGQLIRDSSLSDPDAQIDRDLKLARIDSLKGKQNKPDKPVYVVDSKGTLKLTQNVPGNSVVRQLPQSPETVADKALAKEEAMGVSTDEAGRATLAEEGLRSLTELKLKLFPDGTLDSFNRGGLFKKNIFGKPVANSAEGQSLKRLGETSISGRQLISTGVAARPEETKSLMENLVATGFTNPKEAWDQINQQERFYVDFLKKISPKSSVGKTSKKTDSSKKSDPLGLRS